MYMTEKRAQFNWSGPADVKDDLLELARRSGLKPTQVITQLIREAIMRGEPPFTPRDQRAKSPPAQ